MTDTVERLRECIVKNRTAEPPTWGDVAVLICRLDGIRDDTVEAVLVTADSIADMLEASPCMQLGASAVANGIRREFGA